MMYKCKLQIEATDRKLSNEDGINLKDLSELLSKLIKCLGNKASLFTLVDIENSSYTPTFETDVEAAVDEFNLIHESVNDINPQQLPKDQREYASALKRILFERGLYITASNSKDERSVRLIELSKHKKKGYYVSITSITGKLKAMYGIVEYNPHVFVITPNGYEHRIYVTPKQELELSHYYKNINLKFRIRNKIDLLSGDTIQSNLIDFEPLSDNNLYSTIQNVKSEYGDIFKNIEDSAALLQDLRNN